MNKSEICRPAQEKLAIFVHFDKNIIDSSLPNRPRPRALG